MSEDEGLTDAAAADTAHDGHMHDSSLAQAPSTPVSPPPNIDTPLFGELLQSMCLEDFMLATKDLHFHGDLDPRSRTRIQRELEKHQEEQDALGNLGFTIHPIADSLCFFLCSFEGPHGTSYEGGVFHMAIGLRHTYPMKAPYCQLATKVYHPNIDSSGRLCMSVLGEAWCPVHTIRTLMLSIQSLLDDPGVNDPLVPEIAKLYLEDRPAYEETARRYTEMYAKEVNPSREVIDKCIGICRTLEAAGSLDPAVSEVDFRSRLLGFSP